MIQIILILKNSCLNRKEEGHWMFRKSQVKDGHVLDYKRVSTT